MVVRAGGTTEEGLLAVVGSGGGVAETMEMDMDMDMETEPRTQLTRIRRG